MSTALKPNNRHACRTGPGHKERHRRRAAHPGKSWAHGPRRGVDPYSHFGQTKIAGRIRFVCLGFPMTDGQWGDEAEETAKVSQPGSLIAMGAPYSSSN